MNDTSIPASIATESRFGYESLVIQAGGYRAEVLVGRGFQVIRLHDESRRLEILRTPVSEAEYLATPFVFGVPVLVPPNRIDAGKFSAAGRSYCFPVNEPERNTHIHGMLHRMKWTVSRMEVTGACATVCGTYVNSPGTEFFGMFPHEFKLDLTYELSSGGLKQTMQVRNMGAASMPYALGYHTTFAYPFSGECSWKCKLAVGREVELNERKLPTGKFLDGTPVTAMRSGAVFRNDKALSAHATIKSIDSTDETLTGVAFEDEFGRRKIVYEVGPGFKYWMLYNGGGNSGFLCVEPQTWVINAPNLEHFETDTGLVVLAPGGIREDETRIYSR